ncbi:MAG TPA: TonB family protein [Methylocystis sp.]|nr:TonB family protein [Methylocystis sp.]
MTMPQLTIPRPPMRQWALVALLVAVVHAAIALLLIRYSSSIPSPRATPRLVVLLEAPPMQARSPAPVVPTEPPPQAEAPQAPEPSLSAPATIAEAPPPVAPVVEPKPSPAGAQRVEEGFPLPPRRPKFLGRDATDATAVGSVTPPPGQAAALMAGKAWRNSVSTRLAAQVQRAESRETKRVTALISVTIGRDGRLVAARILKSSGFKEFDAEALAAARHGSPYRPPPPESASALESLQLPVRGEVPVEIKQVEPQP